MSSLYLNGVSYPVFKIKTLANELVEVINLDLCGENGLTEEYEEDYKRVTLESNSRIIDYDFRGARIKFILDYSDYVRVDNLMNIEKLFFYNSLPETYKIILSPRADIGARQFEVRLADGKYSLGIQPDAYNHKDPVIEFITVIPSSKYFTDPNDIYIPLSIHSST